MGTWSICSACSISRWKTRPRWRERRRLKREASRSGRPRGAGGHCAEQPAVQQARETTHARHRDVGGVAAGGEAGRVVDEAGASKAAVALPAVGVDDRAGRRDVGDEVGQDRLRAVWGCEPGGRVRQAPRGERFNGDRNDRFACEGAATRPTQPSRSPTSSSPASWSRPGLTIARRSLCSIAQAVR